MGVQKNKQRIFESIYPWNELEDHVGVVFQNKEILYTVFTHSSYVNEHRNTFYEHNERLEYLGDAVLEFTVSSYLYQLYPDYSEGDLTKLRASIVCEPSLHKIALECQFDEFIILGKGEEKNGGRNRPALLADVFEAFVGGLYLDQGIEKVQQFLESHVFWKINSGVFSHVMDFKTILQEKVQENGTISIEYQLLEEYGPAHEKTFISQVIVDSVVLGIGEGKSKKEAEQRAAEKGLLRLNQKP